VELKAGGDGKIRIVSWRVFLLTLSDSEVLPPQNWLVTRRPAEKTDNFHL
jgi:hypothetical protein